MPTTSQSHSSPAPKQQQQQSRPHLSMALDRSRVSCLWPGCQITRGGSGTDRLSRLGPPSQDRLLAKKAWKDREVFQQRPKPDQNDPAQLEERRKLEQVAKDMGGQIMSADQLGLPPSQRDDLEKKLECSLGNSFAREVRSAAEDVIGSIADLFHSLLDDRAKKALEQHHRLVIVPTVSSPVSARNSNHSLSTATTARQSSASAPLPPTTSSGRRAPSTSARETPTERHALSLRLLPTGFAPRCSSRVSAGPTSKHASEVGTTGSSSCAMAFKS